MELYITGDFCQAQELEKIFKIKLPDDDIYFVMRLSNALSSSCSRTRTVFFGALVNCSKRLRGVINEDTILHLNLSDTYILIPVKLNKKKGGCLYLGTIFSQVIKRGKFVYLARKGGGKMKARLQIKEDYEKALNPSETQKEVRKEKVKKGLARKYASLSTRKFNKLAQMSWARDEKLLKTLLKKLDNDEEALFNQVKLFFNLDDLRGKDVLSFYNFMRNLLEKNLKLTEELVFAANKLKVHSYTGFKLISIAFKKYGVKEIRALAESSQVRKADGFKLLCKICANKDEVDIKEISRSLCLYEGSASNKKQWLRCGCYYCQLALKANKGLVDRTKIAQEFFRQAKIFDYTYQTEILDVFKMEDELGSRKSSRSLLREIIKEKKEELRQKYGKKFVKDYSNLRKFVKREINGLGLSRD